MGKSVRKSDLLGSWQVTAIGYKQADQVSRIEPALPGLFLFTQEHYSMTWMPGSQLQADYADLWHPTDREKVGSYNAVVVNAGSYSIDGDLLTTQVQVAKTPAFMGGYAVYQIQLDGDNLQLTVKDNVAHDGTRDTAYLQIETHIFLRRCERYQSL